MSSERPLCQPPGSRVGSIELLREVDEYFAAGATVGPGDTVVDVGANVGAFSLRVAERCSGDVTLLCFEPSPSTYQALRANFQKNAVLRSSRHALHPVGLTGPEHAGADISFYNFRRVPTNSTFHLADKRREFEIYFEDRGRRIHETLKASWPRLGRLLERLVAGLPKGRLGWWVSCWLTGLEESKARLETLDEMLLRERVTRVHLLKVDVEGLEFEVLRGLGAQTWPLVQQVVLETNNRDGRQTEIERLLRANGLNRIQITPQATLDNGLESVVLLAQRPVSDAEESARRCTRTTSPTSCPTASEAST